MLEGATAPNAHRDQVDLAPEEGQTDLGVPVSREAHAACCSSFRAGVGRRARDLSESVIERVVYRLAACPQLDQRGIEAVSQIVPADERHVRSGIRQQHSEAHQRTVDRYGVLKQGG
jgi:hypothetical protein